MKMLDWICSPCHNRWFNGRSYVFMHIADECVLGQANNKSEKRKKSGCFHLQLMCKEVMLFCVQQFGNIGQLVCQFYWYSIISSVTAPQSKAKTIESKTRITPINTNLILRNNFFFLIDLISAHMHIRSTNMSWKSIQQCGIFMNWSQHCCNIYSDVM